MATHTVDGANLEAVPKFTRILSPRPALLKYTDNLIIFNIKSKILLK